MLLKAAPAFSLLNATGDNLGSLFPSVSSLSNKNLSVSPSFLRSKTGSGFVVCASKGANNRPLTGVVFEPFEEVKKELNLVPNVPQVSLARQKFTDESEAAINEQIKWDFFFSSFLLSDHSFIVKKWLICFNWYRKWFLYTGTGLKILYLLFLWHVLFIWCLILILRWCFPYLDLRFVVLWVHLCFVWVFLVKYIALVICFLIINYVVFGMAVWSTMSHMCTMRCLPTSIEIMWHSRALPSKFPWKFSVFYKLSLLFYVFSSLFCYMLLKLIHNIFFSNRFFKESSIEEREHAEKLMEYQVIKFIIWYSYLLFFSFSI